MVPVDAAGAASGTKKNKKNKNKPQPTVTTGAQLNVTEEIIKQNKDKISIYNVNAQYWYPFAHKLLKDYPNDLLITQLKHKHDTNSIDAQRIKFTSDAADFLFSTSVIVLEVIKKKTIRTRRDRFMVILCYSRYH